MRSMKSSQMETPASWSCFSRFGRELRELELRELALREFELRELERRDFEPRDLETCDLTRDLARRVGFFFVGTVFNRC